MAPDSPQPLAPSGLVRQGAESSSVTTIGGTSAVAPLMAGLMARINEATTKKFGKTVGFINPLIYASHAQGVFRDITVGNNDITGDLHGMYKAGPGWDACSGLGVPNGAALQNLLVA